jgi:toxin ParE1/3/4
VRRNVRFLPAADADLRELYDHIAVQSGTRIAMDYVERVHTTCMRLEVSPYRGTRHDEIRPGIRTFGFERRVTIVFKVLKHEVVIARILYGGRDVVLAMRNYSGDARVSFRSRRRHHLDKMVKMVPKPASVNPQGRVGSLASPPCGV